MSIIEQSRVNPDTDVRDHEKWLRVQVDINFHVSAALDVSPEIIVFDDGRAANAFAVDQDVTQSCGYRETVLIGKTLATRVFSSYEDDWPAVLSFIVSHEFAHIRQFRVGRLPAGQQTELHADVLGGWVMAKISGGRMLERSWNAILREVREAGAGVPGSPSYHGTSAQRAAAIREGYALAVRGVRRVDDAFGEARRYVGG